MCSRRTPQSSTNLLGLTGRLPAAGRAESEQRWRRKGQAVAASDRRRHSVWRPPSALRAQSAAQHLHSAAGGAASPAAPRSPAARCCWCCRDAARPLSCRPTAWAACRSDMAAHCSPLGAALGLGQAQGRRRGWATSAADPGDDDPRDAAPGSWGWGSGGGRPRTAALPSGRLREVPGRGRGTGIAGARQ